MAVYKCWSGKCAFDKQEFEPDAKDEEEGKLFVIPGTNGTDIGYVHFCPFCGNEEIEVVDRTGNDKSQYDWRND